MLTAEENEMLTRVGPGTPVGELLRRYWHPVAIAKEISGENPVKFVRILGEDLALFRDKKGGVGLIADRTRERLATSDHGVVMFREMLRREIEKVGRNLDPMNVIRDPDHSIIDTKMDESLLAEKAGSVTYHLPASR